ncbi:MAG: hypothetical protein GTO55_06840 [Armatimonadetes bacterium]|nr:hypothetical protein [Armatimonadota bacterium]NIM23994.1 hypothetical protein [Armatimonadota bacterium]NIM67844.1 hypothetical protein [Armatimonadota bacterium]NIM76375.1 hypothetical protein [Armatimonadota bacterium]NIN06074.1 hypothetical protein [Armatimonadota bacterium]
MLLVELPSADVVMANTSARRLLDWEEMGARTLSRDNPAESVLLGLVDEAEAGPNGNAEREFASKGRVLRVRVALARDAAGEPKRCLFTLVDVTREREVELLREDLSSMIVHDLRTPLTTVMAALETLASEEVESENARRELVEIGLSGARSLLGLVNTLLDISSLENGEVPLERAEARIEDLVEAALAQVAPLIQEAKLEVVTDIVDLPLVISLDREKIQRVLVNLLGNAVKFTPSEGKITISVCNDEAHGWVLISVEDTGEGVPEEYQERIFDKFEQAANQKGGRGLSTGLGLTFCKLAVEAHGGRIWVESPLSIDEVSGKVKGSRFSFTLPVGLPGSA